MPSQHALLSASASHRWAECTPSARLESKLRDRFGEKGSRYTEEGTLGHSLAELKLRKENGELNEFAYSEQRKALEEEVEQKGFDIKELDRITDNYCDVVLGKLFEARKSDPSAQLLIEQRLDFSPWVPQGFGTGDAVIISDKTLEICDLKTGAGVPVSAVDNSQARLYGLGALNEFGRLYNFTHIRNTIIQPRLDSVSEETLTRNELIEWAAYIKERAEIAWKGEGEYTPGEHCKFCLARSLCVARVNQSLRELKHGFDSPDLISLDDIPGILEVADTALAWFKDIKAYALEQALKGADVKGYKLVRGRNGRRTFINPENVRTILNRAGYTAEQIEKRELKGLSDIEKLIGKRGFEALLKDEVTQAQGALILVPESDKRPAADSAETVFSDLTDNN